MLSIGKASAETALIALKQARENEQSITAQLRIQNAIAEISLVLEQALDSLMTGTGEFRTIELFPNENGRPAIHCTECGAYVTITKQTMHTGWHNKVANL